MNPFSNLLTRLFARNRAKTSARTKTQTSNSVRLAVQELDDRCLPSTSPLTLASNHNLVDGSTVVLQNVESYQWSSTTSMGFALQQGGNLDDFTFALPTKLHAVIGNNIESFGLSSDGTIYDLVEGGSFQVSTNSGTSWSRLDTQTEAFGVTTNDTLYDLDAGDQLRYSANRGTAWTIVDSNTNSFAVTTSGTLYNLIAGGVLKSSTNSGSSWTSLDTSVESFAITTSGTLYDLDRGGMLRVLPSGGVWKTLDTDTQAFAASPGNTLYNLISGGTLKSSTNSGNSWSTLDSNAQTVSVAANGALYVMDTGGTLRLLSYSGSSWQTVDSSVQSFALTPNGTVYDLESGGLLRSLSSPSASWSLWDNGTNSFAVSPNGTLYDMDQGGQLWDFLGGYWVWLDNTTQSFAISADGLVYNLLAGGLLEYAAGPNGTWYTLDTSALSFALDSAGNLYDQDVGGGLWELPQYGNWKWLDYTCQSFAVSQNGTLFDLQTGGNLEYTNNLGTAWTGLDTDTQAFAVTSNGLLYDQADSPDSLWTTTNLGSGWSWVDSDTQAFSVGTNGTLYNLQTGGVLEYSNNSGSSWTTLDTATQAFAVSGNGTLYDLADSPGVLWSTTNLGGAWNWLDGNTQSFAVGINGALYNLQTGGLLEYSSDSGGSWNTLDDATQAFAASANGTLYDLADSAGTLWVTTDLGGAWNWLDGNTLSFSVGTDGTLYDQLTGGVLEYSNDSGNTWTQIDGATLAFAVSGNGTLYDQSDTTGFLYTTTDLGSGWYWTGNRTESFAVGTNGTLYELLVGGVLEYSNDAGNTWTTLNTDTQSFAVSGDGTLYDLAGSPEVLSSTTNLGTNWNELDSNTLLIAVGTNGTLYSLLTNGVLEYSTNFSTAWVTLDSDTQSFAVDAGGTVYNLLSNGQLEYTTNLGSSWSSEDLETRAFALSSNGTVYNLLSNGQLEYSADFGTTWSSTLDSTSQTTQSFAVNGSGTIFNLLTTGALEFTANFGNSWATAPFSNVQSFAITNNGTIDLLASGQLQCSTDFGNTWNTVDSTAQEYALTSNGTLYDLETNGTLIAWGGAGQVVDRLVTSFTLNTNGVLTDTNWFNTHLSDAGLAALADSDFARDNSISRTDFIGLLEAVASRGTVTNSEMTTLQTLLGNSSLLNIPNYVENLATKVVDGNPANATYLGQPLGNLAAGSSPTQVLDLMNKWFYGTDKPLVSNPYGLCYEPAFGTLFGTAGPQPSDVIPGALNDGYFLNALSQLAAQSPAAIENMFINNGDGTYTVRFFDNGVPDYVTVDLFLLCTNTTNSQFVYANAGQSIENPGNILWVALAEKAYAQLAEEGWTCTSTANNYASIDSPLPGLKVASQLASPNAPVNQTFDSVFSPNPMPSYFYTETSSSWFPQNMPDAGLAALAQSDDFRDGEITRGDFVGLMEAVASRGPVTSAELTSLENLLASSAVSIPGSVESLGENVVDGSPANAFYQGQALGNLAVGSSPTQVLDLVQKWFYGTDNPTTDLNQASGLGYQYVPANGTLFGNSSTPSFNDVAQGEAADCYFLSALGQLAIQSPTAIENMFTNNGDGTYTVRFFNNGVASYVTVNDNLPMNSNGTFLYADYYQNGQPNQMTSGTNILWVALAEKAYAQLAEEGWSRPAQAVNSYDSIGYGNPSTVISQITNSTIDPVLIVTPGLTANQSAALENQVLNALAAGDIVCVGTPGVITVNNGVLPNGETLDSDHVYMLQSYNTVTGMFTLINPYDDGSGSRTIQVSWSTLVQYIAGGGFDVVTPAAGMSASSAEIS